MIQEDSIFDINSGNILLKNLENGVAKSISPKYTEKESKNPALNKSEGFIIRTINALIDRLVVLSGFNPNIIAISLTVIIMNARIDEAENPQHPT